MTRQLTPADNPAMARVKELATKRAKLQVMLAAIDMEIGQIVQGNGKAYVHEVGTDVAEEDDGGSFERNPQGLPFVVYSLLSEQRLTLKDLVAAILRSGYKTKSKNFSSCVQQVIQQLRNAQAIKKDDRTREYYAVKVSSSVLAKRLSDQNKAKRQARTRKDAG